ncbi:guanylate kinase [Nevskia soli]|uniref:guanylate kinase n=1 Tax=Nevskia soli TaxID=418856 RepID=UPI0015D70C14|nr:guanylate kinase [Nevskia soli]
MGTPVVFIISAPSGSGKSTLVARLLRDVPRLTFSVSYTTRRPRGAEQNGEDYVFTTREDFEARIANDEFLEYADVFGNYYGTHYGVLSAAEVKGCDLVLDIDVQGAAQLKRKVPGAVSIFILPPSRKVLEARLRSRSEDSDAVIERRLHDAAREIENYRAYDYVLINDNLEESSLTLIGIVRAERVRRARVEEQIQPILETFQDGLQHAALQEDRS